MDSVLYFSFAKAYMQELDSRFNQLKAVPDDQICAIVARGEAKI